jgi:GTPase SAR1 family protein
MSTDFKNKRGKYCQLVMGPAGSGKTTYCEKMVEFCEPLERHVTIINLDPGRECTPNSVDIDICDLISLEDAMGHENLGPNGALIYCMEYLLKNLDWLEEQLGDYDYDYIIIDCPGQIELYNHLSPMKELVKFLQGLNYNVITLFLVDSLIVKDMSKYISGTLMCLSSMMHFSTPHLNILTKIDILKKQLTKNQYKQYKHFFDFNSESVLENINVLTSNFNYEPNDVIFNSKYENLTKALINILDTNNFVSFLPLDYNNEKYLNIILQNTDLAMVYGSDDIPSEPNINENPDENPDENEDE